MPPDIETEMALGKKAPLRQIFKFLAGEIKQGADAALMQLRQQGIPVGRKRAAQIIPVNGEPGAQAGDIIAEQVQMKMAGIL